MADETKRDRLKAALRENLRRRKVQGRNRDEAVSAEPAAEGASEQDGRDRR